MTRPTLVKIISANPETIAICGLPKWMAVFAIIPAVISQLNLTETDLATTRTPLIAGNWKMNFTPSEAVALANALKTGLHNTGGEVEYLVCPSFLSLAAVADTLKGSPIKVGAQDLHWESDATKRNYTAQVAPDMAKEFITYTIVGHSEVRKYLGDTDQRVNLKAKNALAHGLNVIIAVGEQLEQRNAGTHIQVVADQVRAAFQEITPDKLERIVIAYEPVWAIGTGIAATPENAREIHSQAIRATLSELYGDDAANQMRIQYGGSVNADNIGGFMQEAEVDGALIGGASLKADSFIKMIETTRSLKA